MKDLTPELSSLSNAELINSNTSWKTKLTKKEIDFIELNITRGFYSPDGARSRLASLGFNMENEYDEYIDKRWASHQVRALMLISQGELPRSVQVIEQILHISDGEWGHLSIGPFLPPKE